MPEKALSLKDYLETATETSKRVRFTTIILVVITVLVFAGFLNSWHDYSWSFLRVNALEHKDSKYYKEIFNECLSEGNDERQCNKFIKTLHDYLVKSLTENNYNIKVPFFGASFDINDLGLLGGISIIIVLSMLRLALRNYIISLRIGFKAAFKANEHEDFYDILASRQLFVFPYLEAQTQSYYAGETEEIWGNSRIRKINYFFKNVSVSYKESIKKLIYKNRQTLFQFSSPNKIFDIIILTLWLILLILTFVYFFLFGVFITLAIWLGIFLMGYVIYAIYFAFLERPPYQNRSESSNKYWSATPHTFLKRIPKLICLIPLLVYLLVVVNDYHSLQMGYSVSRLRTISGFTLSIIFLLIIFGFSVWCISKWYEIDGLWKSFQEEIAKKSKLNRKKKT